MATNGISKTTFECFVCQKAGYPNERVLLAGKGANGRTIYLNPDESSHRHRFKERTDPPKTLATSADTILSELAKIRPHHFIHLAV